MAPWVCNQLWWWNTVSKAVQTEQWKAISAPKCAPKQRIKVVLFCMVFWLTKGWQSFTLLHLHQVFVSWGCSERPHLPISGKNLFKNHQSSPASSPLLFLSHPQASRRDAHNVCYMRPIWRHWERAEEQPNSVAEIPALLRCHTNPQHLWVQQGFPSAGFSMWHVSLAYPYSFLAHHKNTQQQIIL